MKAKVIRFSNPKSGHPFSIYFVYAKKGNYILKGDGDEIRAYIRENLFESVYNYTFWKNGQKRGGWSSECLNISRCTKDGKWVSICNTDKSIKAKKWQIIPRTWRLRRSLQNFEIPQKVLKRIPHKWIPEYDELLEWLESMKQAEVSSANIANL